MTHLQCSFDFRPGFARCSRFLTAIFAMLILCPCPAFRTQAAPKTQSGNQRVLVLIISGLGPADQVSINYTTEVSKRQLSKDLSDIAADTGWAIRTPRATTETAKVPGAKPSTSALFEVAGLVNAASGMLPIEPFVNALKRFKTVEIVYLQAPRMRYRGLKDFENKFVKINLSRTGSAYRFLVAVKNSGFEKLNLPLLQPSARPAPRGMATGPRLLLIFGIAAVGAALVYLITARIMSGRRS